MNKNELINNITKSINNTFNELDFVEEKIISQKQKLVDLTVEYSNVFSDISELRKKLSDDVNSLKRDKDLFDIKVEEFKNDVNKFNTNKASVEKELQNKIVSRNNISKEIDVLLEKLQSYTTQVKAKETLCDELKSISKLVVDKTNELKSLNENYVNTQKEMNKLKIDTVNELKSINEDIEKQKKVILPTIEALAEREKAINEKELGLKIIEDRWKKTYATQGVGFRV